MEDLRTAIYEAGVDAVKEARNIWGATQDNEMREEFISALMAGILHRRLSRPIRVEVDYTAIYGELGFTPNTDIINKIGGYRADIVIYSNDAANARPEAIVEVKKFAEGATVFSILADLHKGDAVELTRFTRVYGAVFVCETNRILETRKALLEDALEGQGNILFSPDQQSLKGWAWCFGCLEMSNSGCRQVQ